MRHLEDEAIAPLTFLTSPGITSRTNKQHTVHPTDSQEENYFQLDKGGRVGETVRLRTIAFSPTINTNGLYSISGGVIWYDATSR